ncbi:MAG TPA: pitrilysin family protein [Bauldia sp.]|nr:pitrilysin family protein [Bauldia sp.]
MSRLAAALAFIVLFASGASAMNIDRVVSPHGIEAWLVHDDTVPLIAMSFAFTGGASQDPAGRPGVANMVSGLLDEGAGDLDSQAFQAALDDSSIELSFDAGRDTLSGDLRTLIEDRDQAAHLLHLALTAPRFDSEPVERIRAQILSGIKRGAHDPNTVANDALMTASFPGHPYGRPVRGTEESVGAIAVGDLRQWTQRNMARDNLKVAVVGAIDSAALGKFLDEIFDGLPAKAEQAPVADAIPAIAPQINIEMSIPQTVIRIGGKGLKRDDPEFIPATVASYILGGGGFESRLYGEVREKRGLAYSVSLGLVPFNHAGAIFGSTSTRADQASDVVALIQSEVKRFAEDGPTEAELAAAKSYLTGSYALRFNTSGKIADELLSMQLDNLGIDWIDKRNAAINAVTIDDVRRVARRLFGSGDLTIVRVGEPST